MNDMALVEYLLQKYVENTEKAETAKMKKDDFEYAYYDGKADLAFTILQERFDIKIYETDNEYIADNGICRVRVKKELRA